VAAWEQLQAPYAEWAASAAGAAAAGRQCSVSTPAGANSAGGAENVFAAWGRTAWQVLKPRNIRLLVAKVRGLSCSDLVHY
jgi:hypothetical protein